MANISNKTHYTPPKSTFLSVLYFIECLHHLSSCSWQKPRAYPWHFFHSITQTYNQLLNCVGFASQNFAILLPYLYTHWLLSLLLSWEISDEMCFLFTCSTKFIIEQADAQPLLYTFTESRYSSKHTFKTFSLPYDYSRNLSKVDKEALSGCENKTVKYHLYW